MTALIRIAWTAALLLTAACTASFDKSGQDDPAAQQVALIEASADQAEQSVTAAESALRAGDIESAVRAAQAAMMMAQDSATLLESAANAYGEAAVDYPRRAGRIEGLGQQAFTILESAMPPTAAGIEPAPPPPPQATAEIELLDLGVSLYDTSYGPDGRFGYFAYVAFPSSAQSSCAQRRYVVRHVLDILSDVPRLSQALGVQDNALLAGLLVPIHPQFGDRIAAIQQTKDEDLLLQAYNYPHARQFVRALGLDEDGVYLLAYPEPFEYLSGPPDPAQLGLIDLTGANEKRVAAAIKELRAQATIKSYEFQQRPDRLAVAMVAAFESVGNFLASFGATEARASDVACP